MEKFIRTLITGDYKIYLGILIGSILTMIANEFKILTFTNISLLILVLIFIIVSIKVFKLGIVQDFKVQILEIKFNKNMRCLTISLNNPKTLEGKELFEELFKTIKSNEEFKKFGSKKNNNS